MPFNDMVLAWQDYVEKHASLDAASAAEYLDDFVRTQGRDGTDEERLALSKLLAREAIETPGRHNELLLLQAARFLTRQPETSKPWAEDAAFQWLSDCAAASRLEKETNAAFFAYTAMNNAMQATPDRLEQFTEAHLDRLWERLVDLTFYPDEIDEKQQAGPFTALTMAFLYSSAGAPFAAHDRAQREALVPVLEERLRKLGPPPGTQPNTWSPPLYYTSLMGIAFNVARTGVADMPSAHLLAVDAVVCSEKGSPCPVPPMISYACSLMAVVPAQLPARIEDLPPLEKLSDRLAEMLARLLTLYVTEEGDENTEKLRKDGIKVSLEELALPLVADMVQLLAVVPQYHEEMEPHFFEPPTVGTRGTELLVPQARQLMCSATMPILALAFSHCMYLLSTEDKSLFLQRFGLEACAGILMAGEDQSENGDEDEASGTGEQGRPIGQVEIIEDEAQVPIEERANYIGLDEMLLRLSMMEEMGVQMTNPIEQAAREGKLEGIERKIQDQERNAAEQDERDAIEALAAWHRSKVLNDST